MIGLQGMGLVADDPDTLLRLGVINAPELLLSLAGLLVMAGLAARGARGGVLLTILVLSVIGWITGLAEFGGILGSPPLPALPSNWIFHSLPALGFCLWCLSCSFSISLTRQGR